MNRTNLLKVLMAVGLFGLASNSWALGVPGFPALNTAFGLISGVLVGLLEFYLVIQLMFALAQMHHGQPGAKDKAIWIAVVILLIPFVPAFGQFMYNLFFSTGASPATNVWNGQ